MANEFIIKNGLIVQGGQNQITGSLFNSGSISASFFTGPLTGTASFARSSSYALTASNVNPYSPYTTIFTSSLYGITASFAIPEQFVLLDQSASYSFTCSNLPPANNVANVVLFISHSSIYTSSFLFPAGWKFLGAVPTFMTASKIAVLSLKAYGGDVVLASMTSQY